MVKTKFIYTLTYVNEQLYSTSNSESHSEDVAERLATVDETWWWQPCSEDYLKLLGREQPPLSVKEQNNACVVLTIASIPIFTDEKPDL